MSGFKTHHNPWDESCINESVNDENGRVAAIERRSRYRFRVAGIQQNGLKKTQISSAIFFSYGLSMCSIN